MVTTLTRKKFLAVGGGAAGTLLLPACDLSTEPRNEGGGGQSSKDKGPEAPMLADLVEKGELPKVEERLPKNPRVLEPVDRIGVYGGTWNSALLGVSDTAMFGRTLYDRLVHWDAPWEELVPNIAESFEMNEDGTEYLFTLREGMKWSDGKPFTTDDIMFWYDSAFSNKELTPTPAVYLVGSANDDPVVIEQIDEYQFKFVFTSPNGLLLLWLATYDTAFRLLPKHYLQEFHPDFNANVDELVSSEGFDDWIGLFEAKADPWANPELPRLHAWLPTTALGDGSRVEYVRNPYYFKVDPDGSQLPYLDSVVYDIINEAEAMLLKAVNGEINMNFRSTNTPQNKPVFAQNQEQGGFRFFTMPPSQLNTMMITLNLTHEDPVKREIFRNRDFRIGLSHAINREEIINTVYQRQGEPWQIAPRPGVPFWDGDEMAKQYTEYDPDLANEYLDGAGYTERDADGFRLGPDGKTITFSMLTKNFYVGMVDAMELVKKHWNDVGIDMRVNSVEDSYFQSTVEANTHDGAVDTGDIGFKDILVDPRCFLPAFPQGAFWAMLWYRWYIGDPGDQEEPVEAMRRQMDLYRRELKAQTTEEGQNEIMRQILQISMEEFWIIGVSLPGDGYGTVANNFHNVPESIPDAFRYPTPGPTNPPQYFIEDV